MIAGVAEAHRLPFDLPEAEHELVAGFHTEYGGWKFALVMTGEYLSVILTSAMVVTLFLGGWLGPDFLPPIFWFTLKTALFICFFVLLRASPAPTPIRPVDVSGLEVPVTYYVGESPDHRRCPVVERMINGRTTKRTPAHAAGRPSWSASWLHFGK